MLAKLTLPRLSYYQATLFLFVLVITTNTIKQKPMRKMYPPIESSCSTSMTLTWSLNNVVSPRKAACSISSSFSNSCKLFCCV